jgi:thiamine biosynthesis lipoprotein
MLMGTRLDALLFGDDRKMLENVWDNAESELKRIEKMLNRFDKESEVAKVNVGAQRSFVRVSDELWNILLDCRRYSELTDGYFDITLSDFEKIIFMEETHCILFDKNDLMLDFGGYAKGYAMKCVRKHFDDVGIDRALVNFGNSAALALGTHPFGDSWRIGVEDPYNKTVLTEIALCDDFMSVSGNMPSNPQHIVHPKTAGFIHGDRMVAAVSDDPVDAEVLTTAWIASGEEQEPEWMGRFNLKNTYKIR